MESPNPGGFNQVDSGPWGRCWLSQLEGMLLSVWLEADPTMHRMASYPSCKE